MSSKPPGSVKGQYAIGLNIAEFLSLSLEQTEKRLSTLGISKDALLDPEEPFDHQVAILRYNFLLAERSALVFKIDDPNFWRILRARIQPIILAYLTHEKFIQSLEGDALDKKLKDMVEIYRDRLGVSEQFKDLFFNLRDREVDAAIKNGDVQQQTVYEDQHHYDGSTGVVEIQANVINQLKESLKEQERTEKRLQKQLKEQEEQIYRHEKTIEKIENKNHELLEEIERLSTENLQLKLSIDASTRPVLDKSTEEITTPMPSVDVVSPSVNDELADADRDALLLKIESLERDLENTSAAAYSAFMANSDLGIVILFILTAFKATTINRLGEEVCRSLKTYGLSVAFRVKTETSVNFFGDPKVTDNDKLLFKNNENKGRVVDLGKDYMIFEERTALLAKGMPVNDEERMGRLKDNLNTLMQAAEVAANLIVLNQSAEMQKQRMEQLLVRSNDVFNKLALNLERNRKAVSALVQKTSMDLRTQLQISPGGPQSAKLNTAIKQLESGLAPLFAMEKLVDSAFVNNVSRVVSTLKKDKN